MICQHPSNTITHHFEALKEGTSSAQQHNCGPSGKPRNRPGLQPNEPTPGESRDLCRGSAFWQQPGRSPIQRPWLWEGIFVISRKDKPATTGAKFIFKFALDLIED